MNSKKSKSQGPQPASTDTDCGCGGNPFQTLPPEIQPKKKSWKDKFRKVTCPECKTAYWVDSEADPETELCSSCR